MDHEIQGYYNSDPEREVSRFEHPDGLLEFSTGRYLIEKYLPGSGSVCDIGAGPGRYSDHLCGLGYEVTVVDFSSELLKLAEHRLKENGRNISDFVFASATDLSMFADCQFDHCLLMGPMYHLTLKDDRNVALSELYRIIKPGGFAIVTYLGSYGMLRLGIADMASHYEKISEIERFLKPTAFSASELAGFTACFFSTPETIAGELQEAGFSIVSYASAEGFAGGMRCDLENLFQKNRLAFDNVVKVAVRYCEDLRFRDSGQHLHYVVRKTWSRALV